jgi:hypothetical protein
MKKLAHVVSVLALVATIVPPLMFFADALSLASMKAWMLLSMLVWYGTAPLWTHIKPTK